ncbi:hypothetical protein Hanom_Chr07g00622741 [Helianthus anomalus]
MWIFGGKSWPEFKWNSVMFCVWIQELLRGVKVVGMLARASNLPVGGANERDGFGGTRCYKQRKIYIMIYLFNM